jgi:hypothetical protein
MGFHGFSWFFQCFPQVFPQVFPMFPMSLDQAPGVLGSGLVQSAELRPSAAPAPCLPARAAASGRAAAGPPDPAEASSVEEKKTPSFKGGSHGLTWFSMVQYGLMWFNMV